MRAIAPLLISTLLLSVGFATPGVADAPYAVVTTTACAGFALPACNHVATPSPAGPANQPSIAINPKDPYNLVATAKDYGLGASTACSGKNRVWAGVYSSLDGGLTWKTGYVPGYPGDTRASPLAGVECVSLPIVTFGPDGTAYLVGIALAGTTLGGVFIARSTDGGATWPGSEISWVYRSAQADKEWIAIDASGGIHLVFNDFASTGVYYSRSGATWGSWTPAKRIASFGAGNPAPSVAVGPAGEIYLSWRDGSNIQFARSTDGGATFQARTRVLTVPYEDTAAPRSLFLPYLAADANPASAYAGRLYLVWQDRREGTADIYLATSDDGAGTWSAPLRVNEKGERDQNDRYPALALSPGGKVLVSWMDARHTGKHQTPDAYYAGSTDGGATWSKNVKLSLQPTDSSKSFHQSGAKYLGDYNGLAATDSHTAVAWTGTLLNRADVTVSLVSTPPPLVVIPAAAAPALDAEIPAVYETVPAAL